MPQDPEYESDATPSSDLVDRYLRAQHVDDSSVSLAVVHYRGTQHEFDLGIRYVGSDDPLERAVGADVLAQLGWGEQSFRDESIDALIPLLSDPVPDVIYSAAVALGHRRAERAIPKLVELVCHPNSKVRYGVTYGLLCLEDDRAIQALIRLSQDCDRDVRSWATFGLGSQIETDSPLIRIALIERLSDSDHEVRGEALVGLASRHEPSVVDALKAEWQQDAISLLSLEAAAETGDPSLHPLLLRFRDTLDTSDDPHFTETLDDATTACTPRPNNGAAGQQEGRLMSSQRLS
jgi:HEAT repeats